MTKEKQINDCQVRKHTPGRTSRCSFGRNKTQTTLITTCLTQDTKHSGSG